jgi:hypothetical protein
MYTIDPDFQAEIERHTWTRLSTGYFQRSWSKGGKGSELLHRAVWRLAGRELPQHPLTIDHINRDPSDNRLENLRVATQTLQNYNTKDRARSRHQLPRGVYYLPSNGKKSGKARAKPYAAKVYHRGKQVYCGYYLSPEEAHKAAEAKRHELSMIESQ